jgi:transcriptional regulator with XRE-family HTH domain
MGQLWDIVQTHINSAPYPPSLRQVAARLGVTATTLGNWRDPSDLPRRENLRALAELTEIPYDEVLRAALSDTGYLQPEDAESADAERAAG